MKKVLINLVHPNLDESKVNKHLINEAKKLGNVTINDLYKKYSDFNIDVKAEQELLLNHDIIIFQFPMYWLSSPALLKEWYDKVFEYNFAFGENYKLEGKSFLIATSTGSGTKEYSPSGANKYTVDEILNSFHATANYVKMDYKEPFKTYETFVITGEKLEEKAKEYTDYINKLSA